MKIRATSDLAAFVDTVHTAFGRFPETPDEHGGGLWWSAIEIDRSLMAFTDDEKPIGTATAHSFELTLPGDVLAPAAGITGVGVLPTHRRQGVDVPRALTARGYGGDGELVLDVRDPFLDEHGRYLLTVRDGQAECARTDRAPDLSLDVRDPGSTYLGGTTPSTLIRAGHVETHTPEAAATADALFRSAHPPHCLHWF
ncbi:GNAT family N-acetyltransferase [Lentzea sp. NPDC006480]|uniref:GNAT family N-acetyltransferase n=1 Tax=Lentzea sp. NPDC006480 TaxID=3157176 RepID=UPI0033A112E2